MVIEFPPMTLFPGFTLPDELRILREQIRRLIQEEIIPLEQRLDPDAPDIPDEDFARLSAKTKAAGLWALGAKEEYGGGGLDTFSMCVALEEMSQHRMGLYNPGCGVFGRYPPPAIWAGSKAQIEKYAVPAIRDGVKTFFAITEPSGGSDPAGAIQTRAEGPQPGRLGLGGEAHEVLARDLGRVGIEGLLERDDLVVDEPSDLIAEQAQLLREGEAGEHRHGGNGSSRP